MEASRQTPRRTCWYWLFIVSLVAVLAASPYLTGWFIEQQLNHLHLASVFQIKRFERGWFTSKADSALRFPSLDLRLQHRLEHGPLPLDWMRPAAASLVTALTDRECLKLGLKCDPAQPAMVDSLLYWNGASLHRARIAHIQTPLFSMRGLRAELQLPPLMNPQAAYASSNLGDFSAELQWQAERIVYTALTLENSAGDLQLTGTQNLFNAHSQIGTETLIWQQQRWSDLSLKLRAERLNAVLLLSILSRQWSADQLLKLQNWLAQNPVLTIEELTLGEKLSVQGHARLRPVNLWRLLRRPDLINLLAAVLASAKLELHAEHELAEQLLALWTAGELSPLALQQAKQQFEQWSRAGFVSLHNNDYHAHLSFKDNQFSSN